MKLKNHRLPSSSALRRKSQSLELQIRSKLVGEIGNTEAKKISFDKGNTISVKDSVENEHLRRRRDTRMSSDIDISEVSEIGSNITYQFLLDDPDEEQPPQDRPNQTPAPNSELLVNRFLDDQDQPSTARPVQTSGPMEPGLSLEGGTENEDLSGQGNAGQLHGISEERVGPTGEINIRQEEHPTQNGGQAGTGNLAVITNTDEETHDNLESEPGVDGYSEETGTSVPVATISSSRIPNSDNEHNRRDLPDEEIPGEQSEYTSLKQTSEPTRRPAQEQANSLRNISTVSTENGDIEIDGDVDRNIEGADEAEGTDKDQTTVAVERENDGDGEETLHIDDNEQPETLAGGNGLVPGEGHIESPEHEETPEETRAEKESGKNGDGKGLPDDGHENDGLLSEYNSLRRTSLTAIEPSMPVTEVTETEQENLSSRIPSDSFETMSISSTPLFDYYYQDSEYLDTDYSSLSTSPYSTESPGVSPSSAFVSVSLDSAGLVSPSPSVFTSASVQTTASIVPSSSSESGLKNSIDIGKNDFSFTIHSSYQETFESVRFTFVPITENSEGIILTELSGLPPFLSISKTTSSEVSVSTSFSLDFSSSETERRSTTLSSLVTSPVDIVSETTEFSTLHASSDFVGISDTAWSTTTSETIVTPNMTYTIDSGWTNSHVDQVTGKVPRRVLATIFQLLAFKITVDKHKTYITFEKAFFHYCKVFSFH